jgi:predicted dehydrogenase
MRAVLVGCGHMSTVWRPLLRDRRVDVVAFVDRELARAVAAERDAAAFDDLDAALTAFRPPAASLLVNLTPAAAHPEVIRRGIEAGLDVFTEKPLAELATDARDLADLALAHGRSLSVMQNRRHEPTFTALRDFAAGLTGPLHVSCDLFVPWVYGGYRDEMRSPLLDDMLIHTMDQARCLIAADPEWAFCRESTIAGSWLAGEATVTATLGFSDGTVFSYRGSWCAAGRQTSWNGDWAIRARGCSVHWDGAHAPVVERSDLDEEGRPGAPRRRDILTASTAGDGHARGLDEMLAALASGRPSETSAAANLASVAMVTTARASARQGRVVRIGETLGSGDGRP